VQKCAVCVVAATEITIRSPRVHPSHHRKERIVLDFAGYAELLGAVATHMPRGSPESRYQFDG